MKDKRDEIIEAALNHLTKRKMSLDTKYFSVSTEDMADFALSREAELRRQIADDLEFAHSHVHCIGKRGVGVCETCQLVEKLRGNK